MNQATVHTQDIGGRPAATPESTGQRVLVLAACFASLGLLGWLDHITGYELGFFVFYSVPIGIAAWYAGRWPAIGVALAATITWLLADELSGAKYSTHFYYYWNSSVHFLAFLINAVTIAKIKSDLDRHRQLARELEATREALRAALGESPGHSSVDEGTTPDRTPAQRN
jgi:hypothetical protein